MKKILFLLIVLSTMSCNIMQYYEPKFTIGMTEKEFKETNKSNTQVYGDSSITIYRTVNAYSQAYKFFLFKENKLIKFEESIYPDDYKLMH